MHKIAVCALAGNTGNVFTAPDFKRNRYLAIPACITARTSRRQWETTWHCNVVSYWLGAQTKWSLDYVTKTSKTNPWAYLIVVDKLTGNWIRGIYQFCINVDYVFFFFLCHLSANLRTWGSSLWLVDMSSLARNFTIAKYGLYVIRPAKTKYIMQ